MREGGRGRGEGGRGGPLNQIKACVLLKSGKQQHPGEDVVGIKSYDPPTPLQVTLLFRKRHLKKKREVVL